jgi:[acyl-carrier-protein] S-malonyltransferase
MGRDLAAAFSAARDIFDEVDDALNQRLSKLMFTGPAEQLTLTENAQPALMAASLAALRVLEVEGGISVRTHAALVFGHSLGEYTALAAAGALGVADTARLLRRRGLAMQRAVAPGEGAMAALLGVDLEAAGQICEAARVRPGDAEAGEDDVTQVVEVANDNGGGQVVISGHREAVERAADLARARGVKRAMLLPVSAPFHCSLMAPAAREMEEALSEAAMARPLVPLIANVTARKAVDPDEIRALLVRQVTGTVRWRESVIAAAAMGVDRFVELGAGKVLAGLVRRIAPDADAASAGTPDEIEAVVKGI